MRGLAVVVVSAVAVLGLPLAAAGNSIDSQMNNAHANKTVRVFAPHPGTNTASIKNDGYNTTVGLQAGGTSDIDTMRFELSTDGGTQWTSIGGVLASRNDDGSWSLEWNPLASGLVVGQSFLVRANGHSTQDDQSHTHSGIALTLSDTQDVVSLAPGTNVGVWKASGGAQKVIVSGRASYDGAGTLGIAEPVTGTRINVSAITAAASGWKLVYDIAPVMASPNFAYNAPDQLVFSATPANSNPTASDTEAYTIYNQVLTDLKISANPTDNNPATEVPVTIQAVDQFGSPIAGVNVSSTRDGIQFTAEGQTNVDGIVDANIATSSVEHPTQSVNDGVVEYVGNAGVGDQAVLNPADGDIHEGFSLKQEPISVSLKGHNSRNKKHDILEVAATAEVPLEGARVTLWTKRDGDWVRVGPKRKVLSDGDVVTFKIKDRNGRKKTKYQARVAQTNATLAGKSQVLRRR
jgi:hypothetical protein